MVAAVSLSTAIIRGAVSMWCGNQPIIDDIGDSLANIVSDKTAGYLERRRLTRFFEGCGDAVADRVLNLMTNEFRDLTDNERQAAILAVRDTFEKANANQKLLIAADLDARILQTKLNETAASVLSSALLSESAERLFQILLNESCAHAIEVITTLPSFQSGALAEILRRERILIDTLVQVLERLPSRRGPEDFAADYRRMIVNRLDRMELFGSTTEVTTRLYPLSVAYVSLSVLDIPDSANKSRTGQMRVVRRWTREARLDIEGVLAGNRRTLLMGRAGSGKTTLQRWLAVRSATGDFNGAMNQWNDTVPFFIPLRQFVEKSLPRPEQFPEPVGWSVTHEMPDGWVHNLMRSGRAVVLIDGVDELPEERRKDVKEWLGDLIALFPNARYVVTSRPEAIEAGWLRDAGFLAVELQSMTMADIREFISRWHEAIASELTDSEESTQLVQYEQSLIVAVEADHHLRALVANPLLCALLCALNRELRTSLPRVRMEIYEAALKMLLERRDPERGISSFGPSLTRTEKTLLLQQLALWLARNRLSDAPSDRMAAQIQTSLGLLRREDDRPSANDVLKNLLERSGLLTEPVVGRIGFVHRTFQEYLAGKAAVEDDMIEELVRNAHDDQWREIVVMAAGHAQPHQCAELLQTLLKRGRQGPHQYRLRVLAVACLQNSPQLEPKLRAEVEDVAADLVPPQSREVAESLAPMGEFVLDLLRSRYPKTTSEAAASIHAAALIGGAEAFELVKRLGREFSGIANDLVRAWEFFDPEDYARDVLAQCDEVQDGITLPETKLIKAVLQIPRLKMVRCPIDGRPVNWLGELREHNGLREIQLRAMRLVPIGYLADIIASTTNIPNLQALELDGFYEIDLRAFSSYPPDIRKLVIKRSSTFRNISGLWAGLTELGLIDCGPVFVLKGVDQVPTLKFVRLELSVENLEPLASLPELRRLDLSGDSEYDINCLLSKSQLEINVKNGTPIHRSSASEIAARLNWVDEFPALVARD
jgi:hypothetical protein